METSLRIVLLLLAGAIIAGIIWDGFWSKRRNRRNTLHSNANQIAEDSRFGNKSGLGLQNSKFKTKTTKTQRISKNPFIDDNHFSSEKFDHESFDDVILVKPPSQKFNKLEELNEEPELNEPQDEFREANQANPISGPTESRSDIRRKKTTSTSYAKDLIVLHVMARQPGVFLGKKLFDAFKEASLFYGDMNIFHRHENIDGAGRIMFSLASAVEPGTFDISKIETFITPGLTLFFQMERPNHSIAAFELLLRTAKQLAMRLDAEIKDDEHKYLTLPIIEQYRDRVRQGLVAQR